MMRFFVFCGVWFTLKALGDFCLIFQWVASDNIPDWFHNIPDWFQEKNHAKFFHLMKINIMCFPVSWHGF